MDGRGLWRKIFSGLLSATIAVACSMAAAATAAGYVLPLEGSAPRAEALVVLGGYGVPRAELAARIYGREGAAVVVVSGAGDCDAMRETLIANGVPENVIVSEAASRTTQENARNVAPILRAHNVASAKLVTHWYHARRAIAAFRAAAPGVTFSTASVTPPETPRWRLGWSNEPEAALSEYVKTVWYALAYHVYVRLSPREPAA